MWFSIYHTDWRDAREGLVFRDWRPKGLTPSPQHDRGDPVILRHIADDYFVPGLQTVFDLDEIHRGRAQLHRNLLGRVAVGVDLEEHDLTVGATAHRPAD